MRLVAMGGLLVILGAAAADVAPEHRVGVAAAAAIGILALVFGPRWRRMGP